MSIVGETRLNFQLPRYLPKSEKKEFTDSRAVYRMETQMTGIAADQISEHPRYSMPTIGSLLPSYKNADIEAILAAFSKAAFQNIQDLPATLTSQAVLRNKRARQELAHLYGCSMSQAHPIDQKPKTLFSHFPYMVDEYEAPRQQDNVERAESRAAQMRVSSKDFVVACNSSGVRVPWLDTFNDGAIYPYMSNPYEAQDVLDMQEKWQNRLAIKHGPFVAACTGSHLDETPTKASERSIQKAFIGIIQTDWPDIVAEVYENMDQCWMIKVALSSVDSPHGLAAYFSVLLRNNALIRSFRLTKVVEHWNISPGDGNVYYALRPPWVKQARTETFYALHPEQRSCRLLVTFKEALREVKKQAAHDLEDCASASAQDSVSW